jgi:trans-aconitate 2-methyltransferase
VEYDTHFAGFEWPWYMPEVSDYKALVEAVGFSEARVWGENADRYFPDEKALIGWIDQPSIVSFVHVLPEEVKGQFREAVIERMTGRSRQPNGTYFAAFRRVNVLRRK